MTIPRNSKGSEQGAIVGGAFRLNPIFDWRYSTIEVEIDSAFIRESVHNTMSSEYLK